MNGTAGKMALAALAMGIGLGGCATRESVRDAHAAADMADRHAGTAQARADEAYGVGNNALGVGNNAMNVGNDAKMSAMSAQQKADQNATEVTVLRRRVAYLEHKVFPHRKHHRHHHVAKPQQDKPNNS